MGPQLGFLYNDAYSEILGGKHPAALGGRFEEIWQDTKQESECTFYVGRFLF